MWCSTVGLIVTLTLSILAAPVAAEAQQRDTVPRIGILTPASEASTPLWEAFRQGLRALGYVEGQDIILEYRFAAGKPERFAELAAELVRLKVALLVTDATSAARAAQDATRTIPIVMAVSAAPIEAGLVASLARPGGTITGLSLQSPELGGKRLELLKDTVPTASRVAVLFNPANSNAVHQQRELERAAQLLGMQLHPLEVRRADEVERAVATATSGGADALLVLRDALTGTHMAQILHLAAQRRLPVMAEERACVDAGGLFSYGPSLTDMFRRVAGYVHKILQGAQPADLPIEQPRRFELVLNLKTAHALGLTIPPSILFQADEVIR